MDGSHLATGCPWGSFSPSFAWSLVCNFMATNLISSTNPFASPGYRFFGFSAVVADTTRLLGAISKTPPRLAGTEPCLLKALKRKLGLLRETGGKLACRAGDLNWGLSKTDWDWETGVSEAIFKRNFKKNNIAFAGRERKELLERENGSWLAVAFQVVLKTKRLTKQGVRRWLVRGCIVYVWVFLLCLSSILHWCKMGRFASVSALFIYFQSFMGTTYDVVFVSALIGGVGRRIR